METRDAKTEVKAAAEVPIGRSLTTGVLGYIKMPNGVQIPFGFFNGKICETFNKGAA